MAKERRGRLEDLSDTVRRPVCLGGPGAAGRRTDGWRQARGFRCPRGGSAARREWFWGTGTSVRPPGWSV